MPCIKAEEILAQVLSPAFSSHLEYYVEKFHADPQFLFFHASSTLLRLRVELELHSSVLESCVDCPIDAAAKCVILDALAQAIRIRKAEQEGKAA